MTETSDSIRPGRRAEPFVMTPEWIVVAGLSPQAQALYTTLLAHVNRQREDGLAWPGMDSLAQLMGYRKRQSVGPYLRELAALGAIDIEVKKSARGRRNIYTVHSIQPAGYKGATSLAEFYARKSAGQRGSSAVADYGSSAVADYGSSAVADKNQTKLNQTKETNFRGAAAPRESPVSDEKKSAKTGIPMDFDLTEEMVVWATQNAWRVSSPRIETEKFVNHARSNNRTSADWVASWRNWMLTAQERAPKNGPITTKTGVHVEKFW